MEPKPTGMKLPMWAKVLMVLVTVVLLGMGTIYLMGIAERGRWERYAATLREAGEPLTFEEIEARRADLPDERNSALVIEAAIEEFLPDLDASPFVLLLGARPPRADPAKGIPRYAIDETRVFLDKQRPLLDALQPIMDMPTGRMTFTYETNPMEIPLPDLSSLRTISKLTRLDVILCLVDGDRGGAVDGAIMQFRIAGSLTEDASLIGSLVEMACTRLSLRAIEDILHTSEVSEADLVRLSAALDARRRVNSMQWGMWGERAFCVRAYGLLASGETDFEGLYLGTNTSAPSAVLPEFIIRKNQIRAVEYLTRLTDAGDDSVAMYDAALQMDTELAQLSQTYFLVKMLMPSLSRAVFLQMKLDAILDYTIASIAAERFRLANRRWPALLDELVPAFLDEVPADAFDEGKLLKLAVTDQGIVIYSIGEDTVDDGGDVVAEENQRVAPDLGFLLLDPEHRGVVITDEPRPEEGD